MSSSNYAIDQPADRDDDDSDGGRTSRGAVPQGGGGAGSTPSWPFSITITIEIKGESTCPPDVKVRKG
ncbi:MAG: hypothetical protein JSR59_09715 [Proteobacteria bacterium]|nr:hypothetical protein [Pseudomonadota bacterium]